MSAPVEFDGNICSWPRVKIPSSCRNCEIVVGIDEAGRGPVLGSLIYCIAFWPVSKDAEISTMGFNDSKQLNEMSRDNLFNKIRAHADIGWIIAELSAEYLSNQMLRASPISLNALSYDAVIRALAHLILPNEKGIPLVTDVYVDTVGDPEYYKKTLEAGLSKEYGNFTIEKKADATYKVVSAASIIAKVTRDTLMKEWRCDLKLPPSAVSIGSSFGSGYPGDPACVEWLEKSLDNEKVFMYPADIVRFSWGTVKELAEKSGSVAIKWACDDDAVADPAKSSAIGGITSFLSVGGEKRPIRSNYFLKKRMKHILPSEI